MRRQLGAAALLMTASVLASRVLGYARDAIVAARHGATAETDVYFASFTLPDLMTYMLAGGALSLTFIPLFSRYVHGGREAEGWACFSVVATTMGTLLAAATAVAWVLAPYLLPPLLPGFSAAQLAETVSLTRIVLPAQVAFYLGGLLGATVLSRGRFLEAALAPLIYNACIIVGGLALGPWLGIAGFSWGALAGAFVGPFGLLLLAARKHGMRYTPRWSMKDPDFRTFVRLSLPVMVGFSLVTVDEWLTRYFASDMDGGAISWVQNARRLMLVPVSVLGQAAGQATLPFLARLHAEGKDAEAASVLGDALRIVGFATLAATAWMMVTSEPVVGLFYEHGRFLRADTLASSAALVLLSAGILAWAVQALVARGFYALEDTWTPMLLATGVTVAAVPVYWLLGHRMGFRGLALATTLGMTVTAVVTLATLRRRLPLPMAALALSWARSALVATAAGAAAWLALRAVDGSGYLLRLTASTAAFGLVLAAGATLLRVPEWRSMVSRLRRR